MPYREPIFEKDGYFHVYSRGSEKRTIFLDRKDKERFLNRLTEYKKEFDISIICFCLMNNHYHLLLRQNTEDSTSVSKFISKLNLAYAMYFNKRYERVGPLFQSRFKAKQIETDEYLLHLSRYIHLNPLETVGIDGLENFPWSSLKHYLTADGSIVDSNIILSFFGKAAKDEYLAFVKEQGKTKEGDADLMEGLLFEKISPAQVRVLNGGNGS